MMGWRPKIAWDAERRPRRGVQIVKGKEFAAAPVEVSRDIRRRYPDHCGLFIARSNAAANVAKL